MAKKRNPLSPEDLIEISKRGVKRFVRYDEGRRFNVSDFETYFELIGKGKLPQEEAEKETLQDYMSEYVFTALRKLEGLSFDDFRNTFGVEFFDVYKEQKEIIKKYIAKGLVMVTDTHMALTVAGIDVSNEVMAEFV